MIMKGAGVYVKIHFCVYAYKDISLIIFTYIKPGVISY